MKYLKTYEAKEKVKYKKYILAKEYRKIQEYSIYLINNTNKDERAMAAERRGYNIEIEAVAFFDTDGEEITNIESHIDYVKDSYWLFDTECNKFYYETNNLKNAKDMLQTMINAKKYNL
jgi:hypothetical protein